MAYKSDKVRLRDREVKTLLNQVTEHQIALPEDQMKNAIILRVKTDWAFGGRLPIRYPEVDETERLFI